MSDEDDCVELYITQTSRNDVVDGVENQNVEKELVVQIWQDKSCRCVVKPNYKNISDADDALNIEPFQFAMCKFLTKVTKVQEESKYHGHTLYYLLVLIQKYKNKKGKYCKSVGGNHSKELKKMLDI